MKLSSLTGGLVLLLVVGQAQSVGVPASSKAQAVASPSGEQALRRLLVKDIVMHWGPYVAKAHGEDIHAWAARLVPTFRVAELQKLQAASEAESFQGMLNALIGQKSIETKSLEGVTPANLGDSIADLVFTPLPSCILVDTRVFGGAFTAGVVRHYKASGPNFTAQGGSNTNCGIPANVGTLLVSIQSVNATAKGYFRIWPYSTTMPAASSLSYGIGANAQNEIIQKVSQGLTQDFSVQSAAASHLVVNVLGYFAAPEATALSCTQTANGSSLALSTATPSGMVSSPNCPSGYTRVALVPNMNGDFTNVLAVTPDNGSGSAWFRYIGSGNANVYVASRCCRVPGR